MADANIIKRNECLTELIVHTKDRLVQGVHRMFQGVKMRNQNPSHLLREFQLCLREIPGWTSERLRDEVSYLKDVEHVLDVLASIHALNKDIYGPHSPQWVGMEGLRAFVQECYLHLGRELWRKPHLVYDRVPKTQWLENQQLLERMAIQTIKTLIRRDVMHLHLLPQPLPHSQPQESAPDQMDQVTPQHASAIPYDDPPPIPAPAPAPVPVPIPAAVPVPVPAPAVVASPLAAAPTMDITSIPVTASRPPSRCSSSAATTSASEASSMSRSLSDKDFFADDEPTDPNEKRVVIPNVRGLRSQQRPYYESPGLRKFLESRKKPIFKSWPH